MSNPITITVKLEDMALIASYMSDIQRLEEASKDSFPLLTLSAGSKGTYLCTVSGMTARAVMNLIKEDRKQAIDKLIAPAPVDTAA